nr:transposase [Atopobium sp. oral taxon 416]
MDTGLRTQLEVMALPQAARRCTRASNCLERLNAEVKRTSKLITIFPSEGDDVQFLSHF